MGSAPGCFPVRVRDDRSEQFLACDCEAVTHAVVIDICLSVCLSVRLSVKCVYCDKTKAPSEKSSIMTNRKSPTSFPMIIKHLLQLTQQYSDFGDVLHK